MSKPIPTSAYPFRESTKENHAAAFAKPSSSSSRTILPIQETPSLKATSNQRVVDPMVSQAKAAFRIQTYFINALAEIVHQTPLERGKTSLQGSRADQGWQAAHASLAPTTSDDHTSHVIDHIVEVGVTPARTKPFLKSRLDIDTPEVRALDRNHADPDFVNEFVLSRLPKDGVYSIFSHSRYHMNCNATFENPDESNQYDTMMERKISSFLRELQTGRLNNSETAEESTEKLTQWLMAYYTTSIQNIEKQIANIDAALPCFERMRAFELANLETDEVDPEEFADYMHDVDQFIHLHNSLIEDKPGCPSCSDLRFIRNDFRFLKKMVKMSVEQELPMEDVIHYFKGSRRHLTASMTFNAASFKAKYSLYLQEATAQRDGTAVFTDPCTIVNLGKSIFGVMENRQRRAPTEVELREQIYALSRIATPMKKKIQRKPLQEIQEPATKTGVSSKRSAEKTEDSEEESPSVSKIRTLEFGDPFSPQEDRAQ